jgi:copper oxidase (laccase) domain-containing protein
MKIKRKSDPKGMHAGVSPSIGPCCMEFKGWRELLPEWAWAFKGKGCRMDFWAMTVEQLKEAGLKEENIELSGVCTMCGSGFFSHRRGDSGRFGVMAGVVHT